MPAIRDEAVVIGRLDYSENSQVLVLFTREHGKVRAIAKGIRRATKTRFSTGTDLLDVGSVIVSAKHERAEGLAMLTEWHQTEALGGLRQDLSRLHAAMYAAELTSRLTEDWDPHTRLFDFLLKTLRDLTTNDQPLAAAVRFQIALLRDIGARPSFDACVSCGRKSDLTHFSSFEGGLLCRHCEPVQTEKREVGPRTVSLLGGELKGKSPSDTLLAAAFSLLNYHLSHLMSREPALGTYVVPRPQQRRIE